MIRFIEFADINCMTSPLWNLEWLESSADTHANMCESSELDIKIWKVAELYTSLSIIVADT